MAGTVHGDDITTPHGRRPLLLGGSAVYFALAASRHVRVHLCGIVGADRAPEVVALMADRDVDLTGLQVSDQPTFVWHARHDFERWVAVDTRSEEGCDPLWSAELPPAAAAAPVLFLASMHPRLQLAVRGRSQAELVGADSMVEYAAAAPAAVGEVASRSDILFLNRAELAALCQRPADHWRESASGLLGNGRLRAVVVKAGPAGAACVTATGVVERRALAVERVVDPTGAGDALAGGFLGTCAAAGSGGEVLFPAALEEGLRLAALAVAGFGTEALARG